MARSRKFTDNGYGGNKQRGTDWARNKKRAKKVSMYEIDINKHQKKFIDTEYENDFADY